MSDILLVAAHPDDETIGASTRLAEVSVLVHVTDGAPRDMADARRLGFATREDYASARRQELTDALRAAEVSPRCISLGIADQEASLSIRSIFQSLRNIISEVKPALILTHPYEGGHPDHDACALSVQLAAQDTLVMEFTSYHLKAGAFHAGDFLPAAEPVETVVLDEEQHKTKRRMFECFRTQREMLTLFPTGTEKFRRSPGYDFTKPPHSGTLHYEQQPWGMTGERFCMLAAIAVAT